MAMQITVPGPLSNVDTTARVPLGTVAEDNLGNEYIYLTGVASTTVGKFVTYNVSTFATTLGVVAAANNMGAFAMGAVLAGQFGWYLINGTGPCVTNDVVVANAAAYMTAVAGNVDDAPVATDRIERTYFTAATAGAGAGTVVTRYPQVLGLS